jgi:tRNA(Ile)-lysidine synthase TilS/MesJ
MEREKVIVMLSNGLDSRLAVKISQEQEKEITALYFRLPFSKDCGKEVKAFSKANKVKLKIFDCTKGKLLEEYLNLIEKPKHKYGTSMNPCIDCRIFILKKAKEFADKNKIKYITTGEVLNERPLSQNAKAMEIVEKESGLNKRLIRPLSAIGIHGRSRKKQIELADKYKISYPLPAGGCLLCERELKSRIQAILTKKVPKTYFKLVNLGRHFENSKIILGRNKQENKILEKFKGIKIIPEQPGPTALITNKKHANQAKELMQKYSKHKIKNFNIKN